ncbi:hypothetical protein EV715DRAFT_276654 [Schizophyllum commune]
MASSPSATSLSSKFVRVCRSPFNNRLRFARHVVTDDLESGDTGNTDARQEDNVAIGANNVGFIFGGSTAPGLTPNVRKDTTIPATDAHWHIGHLKFRNMPADEDEAWNRMSTLVYKHDSTTCQIYREEIDTLMVFAGLFSGVVTAFIIESYKWLLEEPEDLSAEYLRQILALLANTTIPSTIQASGRPTLPDNIVSIINGFWFTSLTLSLSSALIGIVSKQWLREYLRDAGRSTQTNLGVRQVKYEGLREWYVNAVITSIPLLLQVALFVFLAGVNYLLWHLQSQVAGAISAFSLIILVFFIVTTVLPAVQYIIAWSGRFQMHRMAQIPYKSAQSLLFLQMFLIIMNCFAWGYDALIAMKGLRRDWSFVAPFQSYSTWAQLDLDWTQRRDESARWNNEPTSIALCVGFVELNFEHRSLRDWIWCCLWSLKDYAVNTKYVLQCVRRVPTIKSNFPSPDGDPLAAEVLPLLNPSVVPQGTSELVLHMLLDSSSAAYVEHMIRIYNSLGHLGLEDIPILVYNKLRNTLQAIPAETTNADTRLQLFYVAQDILRKTRHTERLYGFFLELITAILVHLSHGETRNSSALYSSRDLSLDLSVDILDWLERYPNPGSDWAEYKSRVRWSAQAAVLLARRLASFKPLIDPDNIPTYHARFPDIYALVQRIYTELRSIPAETQPTWESETPIMEVEFIQVKMALDVAREDADAQSTQAAATVRTRPTATAGDRAASPTNEGEKEFPDTQKQRGVRWDEENLRDDATTDFSIQATPSEPSPTDRVGALGRPLVIQDPEQITSGRSIMASTAKQDFGDAPSDPRHAISSRDPTWTTARQGSGSLTAVSYDSGQSKASQRDAQAGTHTNEGSTSTTSYTSRSVSKSPEGIVDQDAPALAGSSAKSLPSQERESLPPSGTKIASPLRASSSAPVIEGGAWPPRANDPSVGLPESSRGTEPSLQQERYAMVPQDKQNLPWKDNVNFEGSSAFPSEGRTSLSVDREAETSTDPRPPASDASTSREVSNPRDVVHGQLPDARPTSRPDEGRDGAGCDTSIWKGHCPPPVRKGIATLPPKETSPLHLNGTLPANRSVSSSGASASLPSPATTPPSSLPRGKLTSPSPNCAVPSSRGNESPPLSGGDNSPGRGSDLAPAWTGSKPRWRL